RDARAPRRVHPGRLRGQQAQADSLAQLAGPAAPSGPANDPARVGPPPPPAGGFPRAVSGPPPALSGAAPPRPPPVRAVFSLRAPPSLAPGAAAMAAPDHAPSGLLRTVIGH